MDYIQTYELFNGGQITQSIINRFKFINGVKDWIEKTYPEFVMAKKYNL